MDYSVHLSDQIGPILRGRRKTLGLTQKEAAGKVGLLPKTVSSMENTPEISSLETFFRLLSALDMEIVLREKGMNSSVSELTPDLW